MEFSVELSKINCEKLTEAVEKIQHAKSIVENVRNGVCRFRRGSEAFDKLMGSLGAELECFDKVVADIGEVSEIIPEVRTVYSQAEDAIVQYAATISALFQGENAVFDSVGRYGGDQNTIRTGLDKLVDYASNENSRILNVTNFAGLSELAREIDKKTAYAGWQMIQKYNELSDIVRKYYPSYTDEQVINFLEKLNDEGCGYIALINTLFPQFFGREDEFEEIFGFSMYDENGDFNYDALVVDLYCATDNHYKNSGGENYVYDNRMEDYINLKEDNSDVDGVGTNQWDREYRWEKYINEHRLIDSNGNITKKDVGLKVDVKLMGNDSEVIVNDFTDLVSKGQLIVSIHPNRLYKMDGTLDSEGDGGHAMTITGMTKKGWFIVSSWGKHFLVNPKHTDVCANHTTEKECDTKPYIRFEQVIYS